MDAWIIFLIIVAVLILLPFTIKIVKQYERGVVLRFGRLMGVRATLVEVKDVLLPEVMQRAMAK